MSTPRTSTVNNQLMYNLFNIHNRSVLYKPLVERGYSPQSKYLYLLSMFAKDVEKCENSRNF